MTQLSSNVERRPGDLTNISEYPKLTKIILVGANWETYLLRAFVG